MASSVNMLGLHCLQQRMGARPRVPPAPLCDRLAFTLQAFCLRGRSPCRRLTQSVSRDPRCVYQALGKESPVRNRPPELLPLGSLFTPLTSCRRVPACALSSAGGAPTCGADPLRAPRHGSQAAAANRKPAADAGCQGECAEAGTEDGKSMFSKRALQAGVPALPVTCREDQAEEVSVPCSLCHLLPQQIQAWLPDVGGVRAGALDPGPATQTQLETVDLALLWINLRVFSVVSFSCWVGSQLCSRPWCSRGSQRSMIPCCPAPRQAHCHQGSPGRGQAPRPRSVHCGEGHIEL